MAKGRKSTVYRDLTEMLYQSNSQDVIAALEAINQNFFQDNAILEKKLEAMDRIFKNLDDRLSYELKKYSLNDNGIMDQITRYLSYNISRDQYQNLNIQLDLGNNNTNKELNNLVTQYIKVYNEYYELFLQGMDTVAQAGTAIREDTLLYTIGIDSTKLKEYVLTQQQMHDFESSRKFFNLIRDENGNTSFRLQTGLSAYEMSAKLYNITTQKNPFDLTKRQLYSEGYISDTRQIIWDVLSKEKIFSESSLKNSSSYAEFVKNGGKEEDLVSLFRSRKYEILNQGIWDELESNQYRNTDGTINKEAIQKRTQAIIAEKFSSGYFLDNLFSGAGGDTTITKETAMLRNLVGTTITDQYSLQQKYFGVSSGREYGFGIMSYSGLKDALRFYSSKDTLMSVINQDFGISYLGYDFDQVNSQLDTQLLNPWIAELNSLGIETTVIGEDWFGEDYY